MNYQQMDKAISLLHQEHNSVGAFAERLFLPTPDRVSDLTHRAEALLAEVGEVPAGGGGVDAVLRSHFREVLEALLGRLADDRGYPFRYVNQVTISLSAFVEIHPAPPAQKAEILRSRMEQMPALIAATVTATGLTAEDRHVMTLETLVNTAGLLARTRRRAGENWRGRVSESALSGLDAAYARAEAACAQAQEDVRRLQAPAQPIMGLGYRDLLAQVFGVSVDELAERTPGDVALLEREMERLAREINPAKSPAQILNEDITPYESPERMLAAMRELTARTRELCGSLLPLPAGEECRIELVPPHLEDLFPWGGYNGPDALAGHLVGTCYINGKNYQSINRGWLMNMALHEAYPGHHTQYVCTASGKLPQSAKLTQLYSRASHAVEGMAHRSEKQFEEIYGDPTFPLFVLHRQMHTAVRILCELEINHYQHGIPAALALYEQYMGFPEQVARGQARLQTMWRGYMTSYFTGHRQFDAIQQSACLSDAAFTRIIFTHGFLSVATLGRIAHLTPDERSNLYADFA